MWNSITEHIAMKSEIWVTETLVSCNLHGQEFHYGKPCFLLSTRNVPYKCRGHCPTTSAHLHKSHASQTLFWPSPIKSGTSKQSGCNSGLVCRKRNGRMKNKSEELQSERNCWVTEGFNHRTDFISNAERIFFGHRPDPRGGRWKWLAYRKQHISTAWHFVIIYIYLKAVNW